MTSFSYADISSMRRVSVRELYRRGSDLLDEVEEQGPILVTRNGRPVAVLAPIRDPALRRKKALEPVPPQEWQRLGANQTAPSTAQEEPLPEVDLDDLMKTLLAEIAWFGGRAWVLNDDAMDRGAGLDKCHTALAMLEIAHLITRRGSGLVPTRLGARYVNERIGVNFIETVGRECFYGYPPERLGYGPPGG